MDQPDPTLPACRTAVFTAAFLLAVSATSSCGCPPPPGSEVTPSPSSAPASPTATAPSTATPISGGPGTLYAWADPLSLGGVDLSFADHTWVTTFDAPSTCPPRPHYWYSWGSCHPAGAGTTARDLGRAPADLALARCICQPDVESYSYTSGNPAHGGIDFYGISGVCHQLSNRILFATTVNGAAPETVEEAHGYWLSRFLFGTYGSDTAEWAARKGQCLSSVAPPTPGTAMRMAAPTMTLDQDLRAMFDERFRGDFSPSTFAQILQLRSALLEEKAVLDKSAMARRFSRRAHADRINALLNEYLVRAAEILGPGGYRRLFGVPPGQRIGLVDPTIAERSEAR